MIFVIEYDREKGQLVQMLSFEDLDRDKAIRARLALEIELLKKNLSREVVLLEAANETALKSTHGRYFNSAVELAKVGGGRVGSLKMEDAGEVRSRLKEMKEHRSTRKDAKRTKSKK